MMRIALALAAMLALASPASPDLTPEQWRSAAAADLAAVHDLLRDNSPATLVPRDSGHFRRWLEDGLAEGWRNLPRVRDGRGYVYLLRGYVTGFRDSHIQFWTEPKAGVSLKATRWTGFVLGWRDGGYEVVYRAAETPDVPPLHARLLACDGVAAERFASTHDRYDGDFALPNGRENGASHLLLDQGDPFVSLPRSCRFAYGGGVHDQPLAWRPLTQDDSRSLNAALRRPSAPLGLERWGDDDWWITVPSMDTKQAWPSFFQQAQAEQASLRNARVVVIDLRGNGGGDSSYARRLATLMWGDELVAAREPRLGPTVWRVSRLNRDYWAEVVDRLAADPAYPEDGKAGVRETLTRMDAALAKGKATFRTGGSSDRPAAPADNPMHARVVLLTDSGCNSACLDLMDLFTAMPDVVQAGAATSADTIFMELTVAPPLPSGIGRLAFGHKAWVDRPRASNRPYTPRPELTWNGGPQDEVGLRTWLRRAAAP